MHLWLALNLLPNVNLSGIDIITHGFGVRAQKCPQKMGTMRKSDIRTGG